MNTSKLMDEIREIRDANSKRHINMTEDERMKEAEKSIQWFFTALGKPVNILRNKAP